MGTVPYNFPPLASMDAGGRILTGVSSGNTGPLASTVFFTAPVRGVYEVAAMLHVTQTDGAGTLSLIVIMPPLLNSVAATAPVTSDVSAFARAALLEAGAKISCSVTAAGLGATTFNVYASVQRIF